MHEENEKMVDGDLILSVDRLWAGYRKNAPAVRDLSFFIQPGEILGLIGPNGAGKSTTIKAILGLIEKSSGQVKLPFACIQRAAKPDCGFLGFPLYHYPRIDTGCILL